MTTTLAPRNYAALASACTPVVQALFTPPQPKQVVRAKRSLQVGDRVQVRQFMRLGKVQTPGEYEVVLVRPRGTVCLGLPGSDGHSYFALSRSEQAKYLMPAKCD